MVPFYKALNFPGWMSWEEMQWLYDTGLKLEGTFVEIGSYKGRSAACLLQGIRDGGGKAELICVDSFAPNPYWVETFGQPSREQLEVNLSQVSPDSECWEIWEMDSLEAASKFVDNSLAGVFIDATHTYEAVLADLQAWMPKVCNGGIISGHDYTGQWPGVIQAVNEEVGTKELIWSLWWRYK